MKKSGGVSVIPCKVNGLSLSFVFDTGASDVSISMTEALFMLKNGFLNEDDIVGKNKYRDANGAIHEGVVIILKEIDIAGIKLYNVLASIVNNTEAPLLLGQSAISKLGVIQLDLETNTITISSKNITNGVTAYPTTKFPVIKDTMRSNANHIKPIKPQSWVIGNTIKTDKLEIAQYDFEKRMTWFSAEYACDALGNGWRLPTKEELNDMFNQKDKIGGFAEDTYWSSTEYDYGNAWNQYFKVFPFSNLSSQHKDSKNWLFSVRAVRDIENNKTQVKPLNIQLHSVIGNPIKLGKLVIAEHDFNKQMTWDEAKKNCSALGEGWRLPTKEELNYIYIHKDEIGGFVKDSYWCSTTDASYKDENGRIFAGELDFEYGYYHTGPVDYDNYVRAVRTY
ncbi:MAG: retroviral-like aspartic protease family protein [Chitinophagaceae bacterium]|nr:retroviral-like aspartic protease family protein [Chitinophagaceae bacterium]